jgi:hypothetical protein|nr:MAG TPA: haloacid dehalogenase-like hydrolase [Caudoviricetes sp.]
MVKEKEVKYRLICMDWIAGELKLARNEVIDYVIEAQSTSGEIIHQDLYCEELVKRYKNDVVIVLDIEGTIVSPKNIPYAAYIFEKFYNFTELPFPIIQVLKDEPMDDLARKSYNSICELCKMNMKKRLDVLNHDLKIHKEQLKTLEEAVENAQTEYDILFGE